VGALSNPDSLHDADELTFNEDFGSAALRAYESVTGQEEMTARTLRAPPDPGGEEWDFDDDAENRRRLPKLSANYLNQG